MTETVFGAILASMFQFPETHMTLALLAVVPAVMLTVMFFVERVENPRPLRARAARSTLQNALRRGR